MIVFALIAAMLLAGALAFVVPPLIRKRVGDAEISHDQTNLAIYRDQIRELDEDLAAGVITAEQHALARTEIERRVLEEVGAGERVTARAKAHRSLAVAIGVAVPTVAIPLYLFLGAPEAMSPGAARSAGNAAGHEVTPDMIRAMVDQLAQKLKTNPEDPDGWQMLAKSHAVLGEHAKAVEAYAEAVKRRPGDAQMLADYADTLAVVNGRRLAGDPEKLIARALEADPRNVKALALAGTAAFEARDYARAAQTWRRILESVPPESELGQRITASIAEADAKAGGKPLAPPPMVAAGAPPATERPAGAQPVAAAAGKSITGAASIADTARGGVAPEDVVFIFARAASGPRMPIAIQRVKVKDLPYEFRLDDSQAMTPTTKLSDVADVVVGARVSRSGSAMPAPGDWESELVPAKPGAAGLRLQISRRVD